MSNKHLPFSLSVQYAHEEPRLTRSRLRLWVSKTLRAIELDESVEKVELTLRFVDKQEAQELNREFREKDYATNVLTFEYGVDPNGILSADIVICIPVLEQEATEQEKPFIHHATHLVIHGVLHALGFDHIAPDEAQEMEEIETKLLETMAIPDPYRVS